jgi:hypothetical protein
MALLFRSERSSFLQQRISCDFLPSSVAYVFKESECLRTLPEFLFSVNPAAECGMEDLGVTIEESRFPT